MLRSIRPPLLPIGATHGFTTFLIRLAAGVGLVVAWAIWHLGAAPLFDALFGRDESTAANPPVIHQAAVPVRPPPRPDRAAKAADIKVVSDRGAAQAGQAACPRHHLPGWRRRQDRAVDRGVRGLCAEFPGLSHLAATQAEALAGIVELVADVVKDMRAGGEPVPKAIADHAYSGKFQARIPPELHCRLAIEAAEAGVSLNRLVSLRLATPAAIGFRQEGGLIQA